MGGKIDMDDLMNMLHSYNIKIEKINMTPHEKAQFNQTFINRLISPLSKIFTNNFSLILSLFCVVPTRIELYDAEVNYDNIIFEALKEDLKEIENRLQLYSFPELNAYTHFLINERNIEIVMQLFKDKHMDTDKYLYKLFNEHALFLGFIYMHEIMHIFNRDIIAGPSLLAYAAQKVREKGAIMTDDRIHEIVNIAMDYFINGTLIKKNPCFDNQIIKTVSFYDEKYDIDNITNRDILDDILNNIEITEYSFGNNDESSGQSNGGASQSSQLSQGNPNSQNQTQSETNTQNDQNQKQDNQSTQDNQSNSGLSGRIQTVKIRGRKYTNIILDKSIDTSNIKDINENTQLDPATATSIIADIINETVAKIRGIGSLEVFAELGIPLEIKMDWAKKLRKRVLYLYDEMNKQGRTWTKPNIFTRHIATLPGYENKGKYPMLYVMVDSSGSMSDIDLRKINYILKELNTRGFGITVLLHDYTLVKEEHFEPKSKDIDEFIKYRYSAGGTSHEEPFKYIEENVDKQDYKKSIVLILSDMYSDINEIYQKYNWPKYIHAIGLVFSNSEYELPFGETIRVE
jgi:hypothetical protein